ncbi:MAG: methionyl-tRNA formyltransferase [Planctomycetota bacterium]|jgi:methionyl-tRNA formyltransferase
MRIVMFGTGPFAVPTFTRLMRATADQVVALVTRPIDDAGQRRKSAANPMRDAAQALSAASPAGSALPVLAPADANASEFVSELRALQPDLLVVCDFGQILSAECLATARWGGINLHGSLLPKYRGAAPIHWAIYKGETTTGVSVIHMTGKLDGGPVLTSASTPIDAEETTETLEPRLAKLGVVPVLEAIELLRHWDGRSPIGRTQDPSAATHARRLRKDDAVLKWKRTARQLANQIRAFQPWPGTYTLIPRDKGEPQRLIVLRAMAVDSESPTTATPGEVVHIAPNALHIATGSGLLALEQVQPAGKKPMPIDAFLRGNPVKLGERFV